MLFTRKAGDGLMASIHKYSPTLYNSSYVLAVMKARFTKYLDKSIDH